MITVRQFRADVRRDLVRKRRGAAIVTSVAALGVGLGGLWAQIVCLVFCGVYLLFAIDQTREIHLLSSDDPRQT